MNSNFGSSSHSNWGSSSNSEVEDKWAQMRQQVEESDEEDKAWCNTTYMAAVAEVMACEETEEQPQWGGSMRRHVFKHLLHDVQHANPYFRQKMDRASRPGFSPHQKVTIAFQMLAYTSLANAIDDIYSMSESTCLGNLAKFCHIVVKIYKEEYLSEPNQEDLERLLHKAEGCGFPSMIGVIRLHALVVEELSHWMARRI
ncbi:uncharacterized protein [Pyrus communis]|uniref:uncharacterized protein n=1 Tax=Pyrus communis TaxID=23211 RepID=UPI0035BFD201